MLKGLDNYAVIKSEDWFPDYFDYDDMDIICEDRNKLTDIILDRLEYYPENVEYSWAFCKYIWEAHVNLPYVDIDELEIYIDNI